MIAVKIFLAIQTIGWQLVEVVRSRHALVPLSIRARPVRDTARLNLAISRVLNDVSHRSATLHGVVSLLDGAVASDGSRTAVTLLDCAHALLENLSEFVLMQLLVSPIFSLGGLGPPELGFGYALSAGDRDYVVLNRLVAFFADVDRTQCDLPVHNLLLLRRPVVNVFPASKITKTLTLFRLDVFGTGD